MKRRIASVPTDVLQDADVAGHGPPCCIASTTATPVGTPFQTTRPAFATSEGSRVRACSRSASLASSAMIVAVS